MNADDQRADDQSAAVPAASAQPFLFWGVILVVLVLDVITKSIAVNVLSPAYVPHPVVGDLLQMTLVYNPGAAFGMNVGEHSRWFFMGLAFIALFVLGKLYRETPSTAHLRTLALSLVCAGAVGNLIDRFRSSRGVIDFIDVGIGAHRFPTFNVADMAVSVGAILLAWVLYQEDRAAMRAKTARANPSGAEQPANQ